MLLVMQMQLFDIQSNPYSMNRQGCWYPNFSKLVFLIKDFPEVCGTNFDLTKMTSKLIHTQL